MSVHVLETPRHLLVGWDPENAAQWRDRGARIATRNLLISMPALLLSFAVWMVWSVVVVNLPAIGFAFGQDQLFWLAALPGVSGATLRIFYSFTVPIFGGRKWTALSTGSLLLPALGIGFAVQDPAAPYWLFIVLALLCGFGGGNFASSMSNISFFYPKAKKGNALALNAGIGNLGVSVVQLIVPLVITAGVFGALGGEPQAWTKGDVTRQMWIQNAGFIWVPFILAATAAAWLGMDDIASARASFREQAVIFRRSHNWIMCWLYTGTFGSFIGFSAGFPLLAKLMFPEVNVLAYAFVAPLVGSLTRAGSGWVSDRFGGARVTVAVFATMIVGVLGVLFFLSMREQPGAFWGFFGMFLVLFAASGVGNASTFQMIPVIFRKQRQHIAARAGTRLADDQLRREADKESAAVIGFSSAVAAYGAFFVPKAYGSAIALTGGPEAALWCFLAFYVTCLATTWWFYARRSSPTRC